MKAQGTICGKNLRIAVSFRQREFEEIGNHADQNFLPTATMVRELAMEALRARRKSEFEGIEMAEGSSPK